MRFYYADSRNSPQGPVTSSEIELLIRNGTLGADPMVVPEGGSHWERFSVYAAGATEVAATQRQSDNGSGAARWPTTRGVKFKQLGDMMDSYSDVLDDQAPNVPSLQQYFCERVARRGMPNVGLEDAAIQDGGLFSGKLLSESRNYYFVVTRSGALIAVRIAAFGKDAYVSWYVFVRRLINLLVVLATFGPIGLGIVLAIIKMYETAAFCVGIGMLLLTAAVIFGLVIARSPLYFFFRQLTFHEHEDIRAASTAVQNSLVEAAELAGIKTRLRPKESFVGAIRPRGI